MGRFRRSVILVGGVLAIGAVIRLLAPSSPAGCWTGGNGFFVVCGCDAHRFIRFHSGFATTYAEHSATADRVPYSRIGWNLWRYDWHDVKWSADGLTFTTDTNTFWTVIPGWFRMKIVAGTNTFVLRRDLSFRKTRAIIAASPSVRTQDELMQRVATRRRAEQTIQPSAAPVCEPRDGSRAGGP